MRVFTIFVAIILIVFPKISNSQLAVGEWREHLPYNNGMSLAEVGDKIYCATKYSLFYYNKSDNSLDRLSKVNGLTDVGINAIGYSKETGVLFIAYDNANIDLIDGTTVYNMPDIKNKIMSGNKSINNLLFVNNLAYLACGFGIVVIDLEKREIKDTYYIGDGGERINVLDLTTDGMLIFAATEEGIYKADINEPFLANYSNWIKLDDLPFPDSKYSAITFLGNRIYSLLDRDNGEGPDVVYVYDYNSWSIWVNSANTQYNSLHESYDRLILVSQYNAAAYDENGSQTNLVYEYGFGSINPNYAILDKDGIFWMSDANFGLVKNTSNWNHEFMHPNGPFRNTTYDIDIKNNSLWVAGGGRNSSWGNLYSRSGIYSFSDNQWESFNTYNTPEINNNIWDITEVAIDPTNSNHVYAGSWGGGGVLEFMNNNLIEIYNDSNSTLQTILPGPYCKIGGMVFDKYNNLWVINSNVQEPVSVRTPNGDWYSFPYGNDIGADDIGDIIVTSRGDKWVILPRGNGLFVFNEKGTFDDTTDDDKVKLNLRDEDGEIINDIFSIAEDKDGAIWIGTNQGVLVYYNPYNVFSNPLISAQRIIVEFSGSPQHLLGTETVTAIKIDGANRKWFGTEGAGVYLMSDDATEQVVNYNSSNSPLFSDNINAIGINDNTGEVFFGTDKGIASFRGTATEGNIDFSGLYAFPNPVRPDYDGDIVIKGTVEDANVKITDISGNLVFETTSLGGQAVWNGKNFNGEKVHTGVYMVFCTNFDGSKTSVTKILFIK